MKRLFYIVILLLWQVSGFTMYAANQLGMNKHGVRTPSMGYVHNLYGFYVDGDYSALFHSIPVVPAMPQGYRVGGGFCYEHQRGVTKIQVGLGVKYQDLTCKVNDSTIMVPNMRDYMGFEYTLQYDFYDRVDRSMAWQLEVPLLVGMDVRHFYCMGGFKFNLNMAGQTYVRTVGTTTGHYEQFIGFASEMDNHGFRKDVALERKGTMVRFKPDVKVSLEAGYEWSHDMEFKSQSSSLKQGAHGEYRVRLAAFAEFGLVNVCPKSDLPLIDIPANYRFDFSEFQLNHVFMTDVAHASSLHNMNVGLKLTVLFGSYVNKRCVICSEWKFKK